MLIFKSLGLQDYAHSLQEMRSFTTNRSESTLDEVWFLEHPPVFTLGQASKQEHLLNPGSIPVIQSDRGGQVTYHGPGQLVGYFLIDINRRKWGVRLLVSTLETILMNLLAVYQIKANTIKGLPGVYVANEKIASIGLRVKKGCTYHGFSLNVAMNLQAFTRINPCGIPHLKMTNLSHFVPQIKIDMIQQKLQELITEHFYANKVL